MIVAVVLIAHHQFEILTNLIQPASFVLDYTSRYRTSYNVWTTVFVLGLERVLICNCTWKSCNYKNNYKTIKVQDYFEYLKLQCPIILYPFRVISSLNSKWRLKVLLWSNSPPRISSLVISLMNQHYLEIHLQAKVNNKVWSYLSRLSNVCF